MADDPWAEFRVQPAASAPPQQAADPWAEFRIQAAPAQAQATNDPGAIASAAVNALNGATLGWAPRARAAIRSALGLGNYEEELAAANQQLADMRAAHPLASGAGEIVGAIASPANKILAPIKGASLAVNTLRAAGQGAIEGGLLGASQSDNLGDIPQTALDTLRGAGTGAVVGGAVAPVATAVGKGLSNFVPSGARAAATELGVNRAAVTKVGEALAQDTATGSLRAPSEGDMLMNLGPQLASRAEGIATQPGEGSNILLDAAKRQAAGEGSRIKAVVDRTLGTDAGRVADAAAVDAERKAAGAQIQAAKQYPGTFDMSSEAAALNAAKNAADGPVATALGRAQRLKVFDGAPKTAEELHQGRMALDDMIEKAGTPATSAGRNAKAALQDARAAVDAKLKQVPGMARADAAFAEARASGEALIDGRHVFEKTYGSADELRAELAAMAPGVRARFLKGARDSISMLMGSATNDAGAVKREFLEKGWNREKLAVLIGPQTAQTVENALEAFANRAKGRSDIGAGSRTAMRNSAQKAFPGPVSSQSITDQLGHIGVTGASLGVLANIANKVSGGLVTKSINASRAETATGAARLLSSEGATRDRIIQVLQQAQQQLGRKLNAQEQIAAVTRAFATPAAVAGAVGAGPSSAPR